MRKKMTTNLTAACIALALFGMTNATWAYESKDGKIVDENNNYQEVHIDGVNWSGFQDTRLVDELGGDVPLYPIARFNKPFGVIDLLKNPGKFSGETGVNENSSVSFKTLRLPINPTTLTDVDEKNTFESWKLNKSYVDPQNPDAGNGAFCNWVNNNCQSKSVRDSLYALIAKLQEQKIRVLVDFHQPGTGWWTRTGNVIEGYSLDDYQNSVALLASEVKKFDNVIGIDVFNEPHNLYWFQPNGSQPAWVDVIARATKAVYAANPKLMLFVEGAKENTQTGDPMRDPIICMTGNFTSIPANSSADGRAYSISQDGGCGAGINNIHFDSNWGENFRALLDPVAAKNGQFKFGDKLREELAKRLSSYELAWLLGNPHRNNDGAHIVFSPHVYGYNVSQGWQSSPAVSPYRFNWNFGFLQDAYYPVVIGEAGYKSDQRQDADFFRDSLAKYLKDKNMHHQLFFWTFNSNSGDTGGIRKNGVNAQLEVDKEQALHNLFYGSSTK